MTQVPEKEKNVKNVNDNANGNSVANVAKNQSQSSSTAVPTAPVSSAGKIQNNIQDVQNLQNQEEEVFEIIPLTHIEERFQLLQEHIKKAIEIVVKKEMLDVSRRGEVLLFFDAWQFIARCLGLIPGIESTKPLILNDIIIGWEARAVLRNAKGQVVGAAEAICSYDERGKEKMPHNLLKSIAQTRALTKVLRTHLSWIVSLVGLPDPEKIPVLKKQIARMQEIVKRGKINTEKVKEIIKKNFNKNSSKELTAKEGAILINILESMANNKNRK